MPCDHWEMTTSDCFTTNPNFHLFLHVFTPTVAQPKYKYYKPIKLEPSSQLVLSVRLRSGNLRFKSSLSYEAHRVILGQSLSSLLYLTHKSVLVKPWMVVIGLCKLLGEWEEWGGNHNSRPCTHFCYQPLQQNRKAIRFSSKY